MKKLSEAEASIMLEMTDKFPYGLAGDYMKRITLEWFEARRAIGINPYGPQNLVEEIKKRMESHENNPQP